MAQKFNVADLQIASPAFGPHGEIPAKYTTEGADLSPPLQWSGVPEGTRSFAVVCHDPDAPLIDGFTHWVLYRIPAEVTSLDEGTGEYVAGRNNVGQEGYMGPAPPPGHGSHHYYFWVYALDEDPRLEAGLTRRQVLERIEDHVIEQARVVGTYER
jgi:Raf kinase inhibitor-like YbhB/YbcL family protein